MLDLCAAPGGKATQLAERAAEVVAVEKHPGRARELEANCRRLGAANVRVVTADALELPADLGEFDRVLVDAPCSGLGVLASRPDLRWRGKPLPELQRDLLRVAAERVKPGGTDRLLGLHAERRGERGGRRCLRARDRVAGRRNGRSSRTRAGRSSCSRPHRDRTSGFFIARLRSPA